MKPKATKAVLPCPLCGRISLEFVGSWEDKKAVRVGCEDDLGDHPTVEELGDDVFQTIEANGGETDLEDEHEDGRVVFITELRGPSGDSPDEAIEKWNGLVRAIRSAAPAPRRST